MQEGSALHTTFLKVLSEPIRSLKEHAKFDLIEELFILLRAGVGAETSHELFIGEILENDFNIIIYTVGLLEML